MSVYVSGMVWKHSRAKGTTFTVLLAIADKSDDSGMAYPKWDTSMKTLARLARVSVRTAQYAVDELVKLGELSRQIHNGEQSNTYQIHLDPTVDMFDSGIPKPVDKSTPPVQPVAGEGCNRVREPLQPVAPNPSPVLPVKPSTPARPKKEPVDKSKVPLAAESWMVAGPSKAIQEWAKKSAYLPWLGLHFDHFCDYLRANPGYAWEHGDYDACLRNCIRADWGDVRMKAQREARAGLRAPGGADQAQPESCSYCQRPWTVKMGGLRSCGDSGHQERMRGGERPVEVLSP